MANSSWHGRMFGEGDVCVVPALGLVLFSACAINVVSMGCISLLDASACFIGSPVYNVVFGILRHYVFSLLVVA